MNLDRSPAGMDIIGKADAVISTLARRGEMTVGDLAEVVEEPVSSTYRLLTSLMGIGWVARGSQRGLYRLGLFFMRIGSVVEESIDIRERALPVLRSLRESSSETTYLCVRHGTRAVCIERLDGRDVRSLELRLGASLPLAIGAAPLAILAFLPEREREDLLEKSVAEVTAERWPVDADDTRAKVAEIRESGFSVSDGDVTPGVAALGAPVFNQRHELVGAISVSGVREHILGSSRADLTRALVEGAATVSAALGFQVDVAA